MPITPEQLEERKHGIGGSDAGAIIGLNRFKSIHDVWSEKVGLREPEPPTEAMLWGNILEPDIAKEYARRTGNEIIGTQPSVKHPEYDFIIGHPDFLVGVNGTKKLLEVKTVGARMSGEWGRSEERRGGKEGRSRWSPFR